MFLIVNRKKLHVVENTIMKDELHTIDKGSNYKSKIVGIDKYVVLGVGIMKYYAIIFFFVLGVYNS